MLLPLVALLVALGTGSAPPTVAPEALVALVALVALGSAPPRGPRPQTHPGSEGKKVAQTAAAQSH